MTSDRVGFTLAETVAAMLVLLSSLIVASVIFARSFAYFNLVEKSTRANSVARDTLEAIRMEAADIDIFLAGVPAYSNRTETQGDLTIVTEVAQVATPRAIPSTTLVAGSSRLMPLSYLRARVQVSWPEAARGGIELTSLLGEPERPMRTSPNPLTLSASGQTFTARLEDALGREIPEVTYRWYAMGQTGTATPLPQTGFGQTMTLSPQTPGSVEVRVQAEYLGVEYQAGTTVSVP